MPPHLLPEGYTDLLFRIYAVPVLTVCEKGEATNVHDAWPGWMSQSDPGHDSIQPFDGLSEDVQAQDDFGETIRSVVANLR